MFKKILMYTLLPCLCFSQFAQAEEGGEAKKSQRLGEIISDKLQNVPILNGLSITGQIKLFGAASNQSLSTDVENPSAVMDGDVFINYKQSFDNFNAGFSIGNKTRSGLIKSGAAIVDTAYVFLDHDKAGEFRVGYSKSAGNLYSIYSENVLVGYNLIDRGGIKYLFTPSTDTILSAGFAKEDTKSFKLVWLSPTVYGWSIGLSYSPNNKDSNLFKGKHSSTYIKDSFTGGISYTYGSEDAFNMKIALAGWTSKGKSEKKIHDAQGYHIGAIFGYKDFKMALGFTDNCKSMLPKDWANPDTTKTGVCVGADDGKVYNIGLAYAYKKWQMSAGYFHAVKKWSKKEKTISNIATIAIQYNVDNVLSLCAEYNNIRAKTCDRAYLSAGKNGIKNNRANMLLFGAKVNI